jgi:acetyltransferase-like isoleucine patch superfamily enzyme
MKFFRAFGASFPVQASLTLVVYAFYAAMIGCCLVPTAVLLSTTFRALLLAALTAGQPVPFSSYLLFSLSAGGGLYLFFVTGVLVMGTLYRLLSFGVKPGRYAAFSPTTLRWLVYSGIYSIAIRLVLPVIRLTFFCNLFYRMCGCRMGRNVRLNTWVLPDSYLLELGDNVVVGGETEISCHIYENDTLFLDRVTVGANTLIGGRCYISPGVRVGSNCLIGLYSYLRRGRIVPDNTKIASVGGMPLRDVFRVQHLHQG